MHRSQHEVHDGPLAGETCGLETMQRRQDTAVSLSGTKAEALKRLRPLVSKSRILPQYDFSVAQWQQRPEESLAAIRRKFAPQLVIVRSSARNEDSWRESKAGAFTSVS